MEKRTFKSWFTNVLWFHYKWILIGGVALVFVASILISDFINQVSPDFTFVVGTINIIRQEDLQEIKALVEDEVGDANGDGEVLVRLEIYVPSTDGNETGTQNLQALDLAFMGDPDKVLYLFDDELSLRFEADYFEQLSDYGISSDQDPFYPVNELPVFQRMLAVNTPFYLCLKGWMISEKDNPDYIRNYDLAVRVINRLSGAN